MVSSSSPTLIRSSSELESSEPESAMFTLATELATPVLSEFAKVVHKELANMGDSGPDPLLLGIFTPLPPTTGEESGDDCSASIE